MKKTKDFTGTYSWPAEEAFGVASHYLKMLEDGESLEYILSLIPAEKAHWVKVFGSDEQGISDLAEFCAEFNRIASAKLGVTI